MRSLILIGLIAVALSAEVPKKLVDLNLSRNQHDNWKNLLLSRDSDVILSGEIGRQVFESDKEVTFTSSILHDGISGGWKVSISWEGPADRVFEDCYEFGSVEWYGGPEQKEQYWPIQHGNLKEYSIVSKELDNSAISERYWLNSAGVYFYVHPETPLFIDYHYVKDDNICFIAKVQDPYSTRRIRNVLSYDIWVFDDAKEAHKHAVGTYLGKPTGIPDQTMIKYPIWSTWARYSRDINESILWEFANEIKDHNFPNAQFEIDDLWEVCYGSLTVDERKLPNLRDLVQKIKDLGFRVTIWVHPFINEGCDPWFSEALNMGYLVVNEEGSTETTWWNANDTRTAIVDFTNPEATLWWTARVQNILDLYGIDSVKFDAGESSWSPQIPVQNGNIELHPGNIVQDYVRAVAEFGPMIEIRAGMRTQDLPVFVRMVDKDTYWGFKNGLATLVTTLLQMNLNGYTLVLPDMIGGNGYNDKPGRELFIRWLQANVFMPTLQYSFVPWDYNDEIIEISRLYTQLHADFAPMIVAAIEECVLNGAPVNPPIWWLDPTDSTALRVWDEFLLGESVLAAPVLEEGAMSRNIYLPVGSWMDGNTKEIHQGPKWIYDYPAPLDILPYFLKQ